MKRYKKTIIPLLAILTIFSMVSCDEHHIEDISWHTWKPGMVYCTTGEIMTYDNVINKGKTPEAVIFYIDKEQETKGIAYAVCLKEYSPKCFSDPDTIKTNQGTSCSIEAFDGLDNTTRLRYSPIMSPVSMSTNAKYYVPSVAEMYELYLARTIVNQTLSKCNADLLPIEECWYWTSTECDFAQADRAWRFSLYSGRFESYDKHSPLPTRPIIMIRLNTKE